ncbi:hypothetical protein IX307_000903 [Bacteroides pyogenes]|nr:hypothetical protein [Bacteroides pyogenes]MBR8786594.1 hypothetical protein [Bacteroides pyogenes]MBR8792077.1 hypothetical protein [Bacteroides pyogenes]
MPGCWIKNAVRKNTCCALFIHTHRCRLYILHSCRLYILTALAIYTHRAGYIFFIRAAYIYTHRADYIYSPCWPYILIYADHIYSPRYPYILTALAVYTHRAGHICSSMLTIYTQCHHMPPCILRTHTPPTTAKSVSAYTRQTPA